MLPLWESKEMIALHTHKYKFTLHKNLNDSSKLLEESNFKEWLFCTAGWVGVESNSRWVVSLAYWNSLIQSVCFTIFGCFHAKSMSINFWHVPALQPFYSTARPPGWSCWPRPEAPVESGCRLGGHLFCTGLRARSPLPNAKATERMMQKPCQKERNCFIIKAYRGALWQYPAFPLFVSPTRQ